MKETKVGNTFLIEGNFVEAASTGFETNVFVHEVGPMVGGHNAVC